MDKQRKAFMEKVRQLIAGELPKIKACFRKANPYISDEEESFIFAALERRLDTVSVRSSFVFWADKYLLEAARSNGLRRKRIRKIDLIRLAFIADAAMAIMYIHNQIYDGKYWVTNSGRISDNLAAGNLLKDTLLDEYLNEFPKRYIPIVKKHLRQAFNNVDQGQGIDKGYGFMELYQDKSVGQWSDAFVENELFLVKDLIEALVKKYPTAKNAIHGNFIRNYLISSSLFKSLAQILLKITGTEDSTLIAFSEVYGLMMQVVSDTANFVLDTNTTNKYGLDVMSDLKNQTITLPIIAYVSLNSGGRDHGNVLDKYIEDQLDGDTAFSLEGKHNDVLKIMIQSKALREGVILGNEFANICLGLLENSNDSILACTKNTVGIANYNKYYAHIFKAKKAYGKREGALL